jgi:hypothetical protein
MAEAAYSKNLLGSRIGLTVFAAWVIVQKILTLSAPSKDRTILQDHFDKFVYNASKLVRIHPETWFPDGHQLTERTTIVLLGRSG